MNLFNNFLYILLLRTHLAGTFALLSTNNDQTYVVTYIGLQSVGDLDTSTAGPQLTLTLFLSHLGIVALFSVEPVLKRGYRCLKNSFMTQ